MSCCCFYKFSYCLWRSHTLHAGKCKTVSFLKVIAFAGLDCFSVYVCVYVGMHACLFVALDNLLFIVAFALFRLIVLYYVSSCRRTHSVT